MKVLASPSEQLGVGNVNTALREGWGLGPVAEAAVPRVSGAVCLGGWLWGLKVL
jgi:hypothetical protein